MECKQIMFGFLASLIVFVSSVFSQQSKMLFLTLMEKNGKVSVVESRIVDGTPRGRFSGNNQMGFVTFNSAGEPVLSGSFPPPPPLMYDYANDDGTMSGGEIPMDSTIWFVRVPVDTTVAYMNFYSHPVAVESVKSRGVIPVGSFSLKEAVK